MRQPFLPQTCRCNLSLPVHRNAPITLLSGVSKFFLKGFKLKKKKFLSIPLNVHLVFEQNNPFFVYFLFNICPAKTDPLEISQFFL